MHSVHYHDSEALGRMSALHAGDMVVLADGSKIVESMVEKIQAEYPLEEWEHSSKVEEVDYTGKRMRLVMKIIRRKMIVVQTKTLEFQLDKKPSLIAFAKANMQG